MSRRITRSDAALFALCAQLEDMQAEWQRLYDLTSEEDELTTPADHAWQAYSDNTWPGLCLSPWTSKGRNPADLPAQLVDLPATTPAGLQAKAAAVLALDEATGYLSDCRNDSAELWASVVRDAAGNAYRPLGADATPSRSKPSGSTAICAGQIPGSPSSDGAVASSSPKAGV